MNAMDDTMELRVLDVPLIEERPWAVFAACKEVCDISFFPETRAEEREALMVCEICPVREECLYDALETRERFGVWGGTTERERKKLSRIG